jgi:hypothetical protein
MNVIKMIKSGLVNQKRGGGFEQGYPSQKYPKGRDEFIRPYVNNSDPTILRKSEYSDPMAYKAITPSPVQYNDIFSKKPTPDERLYILKQIQQGLDKVQKGLLGKIPGAPVVGVPSATAPSGTRPTDEVGQTIGRPPGPPPGGDGAGGILVEDVPDEMLPSPASSAGAQFPEGAEAPQGGFDATQQDGVDDVNAALVVDELAAVDETMNQEGQFVDVVTGNRSMIADAENTQMPGGFPGVESVEEPKEESNDEEQKKIDAGLVRNKIPFWFQTSKSGDKRRKAWMAHYDRERKLEKKKPEMSSATTPTSLPPSLGRRLSK